MAVLQWWVDFASLVTGRRLTRAEAGRWFAVVGVFVVVAVLLAVIFSVLHLG